METGDEETDDILKPNPLTCLFLSGYATQLFLLICYTNKTVIDIESKMIMFNGEKRIQRWLNLFFSDCLTCFSIHSFKFEAELASNSRVPLDPLTMHSNLLITASNKLVKLKEHGEIGVQTMHKFSKWFELISEIFKLPLGQTLPSDLKQELEMTKERFESGPTMNSSNKKEYPHFSPGSLFIRLTFIVYLQKSKMSPNVLSTWQYTNAQTIFQIFSIGDFMKECESISTLETFSTEFPYIHQLPCKILYEKIEKDVPVYHIFVTLLHVIHECMKIYHYHQEYSQSNNDGAKVTSFNNYINEAQYKMEIEFRRIKNCEKQRVHQQNQNKFVSKNKKISVVFNNDEWSMKFLFGSHLDIIFPNKIVFSIKETFAN